ncbi:MAG: HAMP domain-containing protein [Deltaproteobacteria bacterium]|nr:HAMP domain-containing protein [Deltaproteobacteria bacterium]MBI2992062.1 HAMP domain-containing protein [Deltaproteobacteria bacterium]
MKGLEKIRASLALKVTLLVVGILVVAFGMLFFLNIRREEGIRVAKYQETARLLAASIMTSIENGMLEGRPDIIRRLVHEMKKELKDVRRLDVYRRNGVEAFTDLETVHELEMAGAIQPDLVERISKMRREPGTRISHPLFSRAVENGQPQQTYEMTDGGRLLTLFQPLRNLAECQDCHGADHQVRGVLRVSLSLEQLDAEIATERNRRIGIALITIFVLSVTLVVFMGRVVLRPVAHVASVAQQVGGGDFEARVMVATLDEIGRLGMVINDMTTRLKQAYEDLETKNKTLDETLGNLRDTMKRVELLEQIKGELSKFVPESVKKLLEQNPNATELEKSEKDVSVLFLDIAGYTRLSEQMDPKQLNRLVQSYFSSFLEIIHEHHGDVNETAGDGLMVIFQSDRSPVAHAVNATQSAFAIRGRVEELNEEFAGVFQPVFLHMGINSGPALLGATKLASTAGARWTFTATGPVTNLAARIAGQATEGEILVGPTTAERIRGHFILEDIGERMLKNVADPVRLYRVIPPGVYEKVVKRR